jgi:hypothetical protein
LKDYQNCFSRYEIKYLITAEQRARLEAAVLAHLSPDEHGESLIYNIYYDTQDFRIVRRSLEGPVYKEKLRMRSYGRAGASDDVFLELKKKYKQVVYKRRVSMPESEAVAVFADGAPLPRTQIGSEIDSFRRFYRSLVPTVFLSYERSPYYSKDKAGFRVTFDRNILWRDKELTLNSEAYGKPLLLPGQSLMEIKTSDAIPLWLTGLLAENKIFRTSFSKYGRAYENMINEKDRMRYTICSTNFFLESLEAKRHPA